MESVFLLYHVHEFEDDPDREDDVKLLGVFSSREKADDYMQEARSLPGFRDYPESFLISEYVIDRRSWNQGFVTMVDDAE